MGHKMCAQVYTDSEPIRREQKMKAPGKREQRKEQACVPKLLFFQVLDTQELREENKQPKFNGQCV